MKLLLHAIASSEASAATTRGLRDHPLAIVRHAELCAYATWFDPPSEPFGRADLLEHHAIISRLDRIVESVLPARFPTWFADEEALTAELGRRQTDLLEALERVRGRAELAVTAIWSEPAQQSPPPEAATPGRKYLLERQQAFAGTDKRRERAQALAEQTERLVGNDLVEVRHQLCPSATVALSSALLVPRGTAEMVKARLIRAEQDVRILVNGPWPAYTFATVV
jgi:hypothetical protein